ncbi:MAG: TIGR02452 family protein [Oscillospiraceae bacterium]|nr:TIGR02452 family protein [Oscillospiraceae bacterium]
MTNRDELVQIFKDTIDMIETTPALMDAVRSSRSGTKIFHEDVSPILPRNYVSRNSVTVTRSRSFEAAMQLHREFPDERIAVHNFASATNPGGGVERGASAQEECLCRCSTLFPVLKSNRLFSEYYSFHKERHDARYTDACIWSPDIYIIKSDNQSPKRLPESEWCKVDVLTCAAPNLRNKPNNRMNPGTADAVRISDAELLELHLNRARHMLTIAAAQGDTVLVLGAFGCGAFRNPPAVVAKAYKQVLPEFDSYFKRVEFAVYCPPEHPENYKAFQKILG